MTKIEWASLGLPKGVTWNPIRAHNTKTGKRGWHCEKVSPACEHCYAEALNAKAGDTGGTGLPYKPGHRQNGDTDIYLDEKTLLQPLSWRAPRGVFVASMTDIFGDWVPDEWLDRIFAVAILTPQHRYAFLTKRCARQRAYMGDWTTPHRIARVIVDMMIAKRVVPDDNWPVKSIGDIDMPDDITLRVWPPKNTWHGGTTEDQPRANERIPDLLATPAAGLFVSIEPILGPVNLARIPFAYPPSDLTPRINALTAGRESGEPHWALDWVICGGESGPGARPMHPDWARGLASQCREANVAFFMKQMHVDGRLRKDLVSFPSDLQVREFPNAA